MANRLRKCGHWRKGFDVTVDQVLIDSFDAEFDDDEVLVHGHWVLVPPPPPAPPPPGIVMWTIHSDYFPRFDRITWDIGRQTLTPGPGAVLLRQSWASGVVDARESDGMPWRTMSGSQRSTPEAAWDNVESGEFVDEGEFRFSIPADQMAAPPTTLPVIGPAVTLRFGFGTLHATSGGANPDLERIWQYVDLPFTIDTTQPTVSIMLPAPGQVRTSPVRIGGLITDPGESLGIDHAEIGIRDRDRNEWFDFGQGRFLTGERYTNLPLIRTNPQATRFSFDWSEPSDGSQDYEAVVRAVDRASNQRESRRDFRIDRGGPSFTLEGPRIYVGPVFPVTVRIEEDLEVADVDLMIANLSTPDTDFWDGSAWVPHRTWLSANVTAESGGALATYDFTPSGQGTGYLLNIRVRDVAGNTRHGHTNIRLIPVDDRGPHTAVFHPATENQVLPLGITTFRGRIRDDFQPVSVEVRIRDMDSGDSWDGSDWFGSSVWLPGELAGPLPAPAPTGASVEWIYDFDASLALIRGGSGNYRLSARGIDSEANVGEVLRRRFTISD